MSDPTSPAGPENRTDDAGADTTELAPVPALDPKAAEPKAAEPKAAEPKAAEATTAAGATKNAGGTAAAGASAAGAGAAGAGAAKDAGGTAVAAKDASADAGEEPKKKGLRRFKVRGPWVTVGGAVVVLTVLAVLGYFLGLVPLSLLNAKRAITPPAKIAGLDRITDPEIRSQAQLDQTRDALSRINDGKQVMVEAYGSLEGDRFYVLIALRGRVDIDKVVADSGASADKVKKIGKSTCIEAAGNLPTQCYRGSNTLTVIAQSANEGVTVDQVEPVTEEAFKAMR